MQKNHNCKILAVGIICLFVGASIFPIVNAKEIKNRQLNPPQPSPSEIIADFNITFYQPSLMTIKYFRNPPFIMAIWGGFFVIDLSNNPVGRIEYIKESTGSEIAKTFTYFMVGCFSTGYGTNFNTSYYNESTGLGYITGEELSLFYFGL